MSSPPSSPSFGSSPWHLLSVKFSITRYLKMKLTLNTAFLLTLASLLVISIDSVDAQVPLPDYTVHDYPLAATFYWFSSVEVGVCYSPKARVGSIKGALHCTHQENYDLENNTWTLPQTCVALKPLGEPLSNAVRDSCANAKGSFNIIKPASNNADGSQAYDAISNKGAGGAASDPGSQTSSDDDEGDKKDGGMLGGLGKMFGL
ncbi:uncharacterized protein UBRO2_02095 [Ustilago bromivora]|uniref:Pep1 n=2 Tax=Ustilago bromivora TaxID=307758 RepID=A0A8H8QLD1_9BASI|nr:uncharacterized protein UBRO2_02095 [Ustilago bromivora]